jgi:hypothetical protein
MKTLSVALAAALGAPVQRPAILVELAFSPVKRWSSYAELAWDGQTWLKEDVSVESLEVGALTLSGALRLGNGDGAAAALVRAQGVQDRGVRIWGYDAAATGAADVVWLADGICAAAQIGPDAVRIALRHPSEYTLAPRTFVSEAEFAPLLPAGTVLKINGQAYSLARRN